MWKKRTLLCLLLIAVLMLCACNGKGSGDKGGPAEIAVEGVDMSRFAPVKGNDRVFYEIFVGSFSDSNGDGIGDLRGIIDRFDYLNDGDPTSGKSLGVEGIWLTPIFKSISYHKYDVSDYYTVDPSFGTIEDLEELAALCESRNVKLILDLPINHTGKSCAWFGSFVKAHRQKDTSDPYYDFYSWHAKGESDDGRRFDPITGCDDYYECNFDGSMPELNFDSEFVRESVLDVAKFYLDKGIDGFRFDAAKYVYFNDHARSTAFWDWYMAELRKIDPEIYVVAEVWDGDGITDKYYSSMNCFNFTVSQPSGLIADTAKSGDAGRYAKYVENYLDKVKSIRADATIVPFIANHDTDRAAGYLTVSSGQMAMAANLYILGPGSPFIYYGEEIGMRGSRGSAMTDADRRLAMLWGDGDTVKDPEGAHFGPQEGISVADQLARADSLLSHYKRLIMIREANPEIASGEYKAVAVPDSKVGGFTSTLNGSSVLVLHNTSQSAKTVDLKALGLSYSQIAAVVGQEDASLDGTTLTIGGLTSVVLR
ncbi:MAG: hypothetical protein IK095_06925 [Oscillospiraceae bacterium]|nr:hypothetical protein [Oscillospiraceae bacterium]